MQENTMPKANSLIDKLKTKTNNTEFVEEYRNEIGEIEKEYKKFTNGQLIHLARIIQSGCKDIKYYFDLFVKTPNSKKSIHNLDTYIMRYGGNQEVAQEKYNEYVKRQTDASKEMWSGWSEKEKRENHAGYVDYYIKKYGDNDLAIEKYNEYLTKRSEVSKEAIKKSNQTMQNDPSLRATNIEYYYVRYDTKEDAESAYKKRQSTCSLESFVNRHGDKKGYKKWKQRNRKWLATLDSKSDDEKIEINRKRVENRDTKGICSSEANNYFESLEEIYPNLTFQYGTMKDELTLLKDNTRSYYYDGYIKELNLIVEYHGQKFHPKPLQFDWQHLYRNDINYKEARIYDLRKRKLAIDKGYNYLVIWGDWKNDRKFKEFENKVKHCETRIAGNIHRKRA